IVAGVYTDGTAEAVELAKDAKTAGAAGVLLFPPTLFMWGAQVKPDLVSRHYSDADALGLPFVAFEYPPACGIGYSPETLARLATIPEVVAVKDWSNDIVAYEANLRALRATGRPVAMLSSFTMSLMASFLLGADGAISGMGSVTADLQAELFAACQKGDLEDARRINERLEPLVRVFYAPPFVDMHNRMKEALVLLGRIPAAHVRPPLTPVPPAEREAIGQAKPYKIGVLQPLTGAAAAGGKTALVGTQLAADRINKSGGINGRPIELVIADYESKPDVGRRKAEKLVVEDKVDVGEG